MKLEFDPNVKKKPAPIEWASYIPDRSTQPKFKAHKTRGHLLAAFAGGAAFGIAYRWDKDKEEWVEVWRHDKDDPTPTHCHLCGVDLVVTSEDYWGRGRPRTYNRGNWTWINKDKDFPQSIRICYSWECRKKAKSL